MVSEDVNFDILLFGAGGGGEGGGGVVNCNLLKRNNLKQTDLVHQFCLCFFLQLLPQCLCSALWGGKRERRKRWWKGGR